MGLLLLSILLFVATAATADNGLLQKCFDVRRIAANRSTEFKDFEYQFELYKNMTEYSKLSGDLKAMNKYLTDEATVIPDLLEPLLNYDIIAWMAQKKNKVENEEEYEFLRNYLSYYEKNAEYIFPLMDLHYETCEFLKTTVREYRYGRINEFVVSYLVQAQLEKYENIPQRTVEADVDSTPPHFKIIDEISVPLNKNA